MKYAYEDLSEGQFEKLVVGICQKLLGISTQGFAKGPDGGRDAKFVGTAELHPSKSAPWSGTTIIQAKHTNGYNKHFSEGDFYNPDSEHATLSEEIPRIKRLRTRGQLDHYMLFANRRLGGNTESEIRKYIADTCSLPEHSIYLCGVEQLELYLKHFPSVAHLADLDPLDSPLIVSPDDLSDVVSALASQIAGNKQVVALPTPRVPYEEKNKLNNMSAEYAKGQRRKYLAHAREIDDFLAAPENEHLLRKYEAVAEEFNFKIIARRKEYHTFDRVMEYLLDLLFNRDPILNGNKRLTRAMLFYMYWNCDIGEVDNVETEQTFASGQNSDQRLTTVVEPIEEAED
jgi:hypothetical protein